MLAFVLTFFLERRPDFCSLSLAFSQHDSMLESSHGGSYRRPEGMMTWDQEYQLFQPSGAIKFPLQVTDAWIEKVLF